MTLTTISPLTPVIATLKGYQCICCLVAMFTELCFCLIGELHRDSRHAALWGFLYGLSLHNGEQQLQRYCFISSSSRSLFGYLVTSSFFLSHSSLLPPFFLSHSFSLFFSLSTWPTQGLKKELSLFHSQPPGLWPSLSSLSPQTYLQGNCQKCLVYADTYLSFSLLIACWNNVSPSFSLPVSCWESELAPLA